MSEEKDIESKKEKMDTVVRTLEMDIKKLGEVYNIPFTEILEIIKKDRQLALENYNMFKNRMQASEDDSESTKEQINKALQLVIDASSKLSDLVHSASKLWGDTAKALAIRDSNRNRPMDEKQIRGANFRRRQEILDGEVEEEKDKMGKDNEE